MENYNTMAVPQIPRFIDHALNSRARLDTGTECNYKCSFCYYKNRLDISTDFNIIFNRIKHLSTLVDEIELSGGESSIHKDWFKILETCKEYGFKNISTLSNGEMFCDYDFLEKSKECGLKEILFSVHGIGGSHNTSVGIPGAFDKIKEAINNAHKLNIVVRLNCTITSKYFDPILYSEFIKQYSFIKQVNLLPVNSWEDSIKKIDYYKASKSIKIFIDLLKDSVDINVRYIPYCFMEGYEEYVKGVYQHIIDESDWNILMMNDEDIFSLKEKPTLKQLFRKAYDIRKSTYTKTKDCIGCKYILKCDGIEFNNLENNKLVANKGVIIENVLK